MAYEEENKQTVHTEGGVSEGSTTGQEAATVEALQEMMEAEKQRADANLAGWQRAAADLSNYRKRVEQERNDLIKSANADLIRRLLPVLDDLDRAFQTLPDTLGSLTWVQGIMLIDRKLRTILEAEGVTSYEAVGKEFDPAYHDAVLYEDTDPANEGKVLAELQRGYRMNDRVLRPALVKVGRVRSQEPTAKNQEPKV